MGGLGALGRGPTEIWDFEGRWQIARRITDALGPDGVFDGEAVFERGDGGLIYREAGTLRLGKAEFRAERQYLWQADGRGGVTVRFADGRPFHGFDLGDTAAADHACDPDQYRVAYEFARWPSWTSTWQVTGPRKSYVMVSDYTALA